MMITRTLTTFKASAYELAFDNGSPSVREIGSATFSGTRADKTTARKAIGDALGRPLPKGVDINIEPVEEVLYGMDLDKFVELAQVIRKTDMLEVVAPEEVPFA